MSILTNPHFLMKSYSIKMSWPAPIVISFEMHYKISAIK